jgi:hypothetical protein
MSNSQSLDAALRDAIVQHFDEGELQNLCQDLDVDYENLTGDSKTDKARSLTTFMRRRAKMLLLLNRCAQLRPSHPWHQLYGKGITDEAEPIARSTESDGDQTLKELPRQAQQTHYDAYISFANAPADLAWIEQTLVPRLTQAGIRLAVSSDIDQPGVPKIVNIEQAILDTKRTILVLSKAYLVDHIVDFENTIAQTLGVMEAKARVLPIKIEALDEKQLPLRLRMLAMLDFTQAKHTEKEFARLLRALRS